MITYIFYNSIVCFLFCTQIFMIFKLVLTLPFLNYRVNRDSITSPKLSVVNCKKIYLNFFNCICFVLCCDKFKKHQLKFNIIKIH